MPAGRGWTRPEDVRAAVHREWSSGRLLAARVDSDCVPAGIRVPGRTSFPFQVRLRGPRSGELGARFDEVLRWVASFDSVTGYRVLSEERASRSLGRQRLPVAAVIETDRDALELIGRRREAAMFDTLVRQTPPQFRWFAAVHPLTLVEIAADWSAVLVAADWLRRHPNPEVYVRQIDLPGVHTKIVERHRQTIAALVDEGRPRARIGSLSAFEQTYGFRSRPARVRFRSLDPTTAPVPGFVDVTLPVEELARVTPRLRRVVVVENEVTMLAFPPVAGGLVIWGSGNQAPELLEAIPWLHDVALYYWGDLDTHGFAILNRLRAVLPHVRSMLMDRGTLLDHRDRWGRESEPTKRDLPHLTDDEAEVYGGLCADIWGPQVRLEQELIRFGTVEAATACMRDRGNGRA